MKNIRTTVTAAILSIALGTGAALAQSVNGEVKKIDATNSKITLKHGPIKALDMDEDGMTMVFRVKDPEMLKKVKVGDKVKFDASRVDGKITITTIEKAK